MVCGMPLGFTGPGDHSRPRSSDFREIAKDPEKYLAYLRRFMAELHLPMPTFRLWPEEQGNVLAYIITQGYDH